MRNKSKSKSKSSKTTTLSSSKKRSQEKILSTQSVQTIQQVVCVCCDLEIPDGAYLQAHLLLFKHTERTENQDLVCRGCYLYVKPHDMNEHRCVLLKAFYIRYIMSSKVLTCGPPYRCLYCRSHLLKSRMELALHLLGLHRYQQSEDVCGICNEKIDSISHASRSKSSSRSSRKRSPKKKKSKSPSSKKSRSKSAVEPVVSTEEKYEVDEKLIERLRKANKHLMENHAKLYSYEAQNMIKEESLLRQPYACTFCSLVMETNVEFHAHILCCHGNKNDIENRLYICSWCDKYMDSMETLHSHVKINHVKEIEELCSLWLRKEHMQNFSDPSTTCATCWMNFEDIAQMATHILINHTSYEKLKCGLCSKCFVNCENIKLALDVFENHEKNHRSQIISQSQHKELFQDNLLPLPLPEAMYVKEFELLKAKRDQDLTPKTEKKSSKSSSRNSSPKGSKKSSKKKAFH